MRRVRALRADACLLAPLSCHVQDERRGAGAGLHLGLRDGCGRLRRDRHAARADSGALADVVVVVVVVVAIAIVIVVAIALVLMRIIVRILDARTERWRTR